MMTESLFYSTIVIFKANAQMGSVLESLTGAGKSNIMTATRVKMLILEREDILKLGLVGQSHFTWVSGNICTVLMESSKHFSAEERQYAPK